MELPAEKTLSKRDGNGNGNGRRVIRWVAAVLAAGALAVAFVICYGYTLPFVGWLVLVGLLAVSLRRRAKCFSVFLWAWVVAGLVLWPLDAALKFPVLRKMYGLMLFGPRVTPYPSPSGKSTAYVFNHGFVDSAFSVRVAHGLGFPEKGRFVPLGTLSDTDIEPRWQGRHFVVRVSGLGTTLYYDEETKTMTTAKGPDWDLKVPE